jgi:hypothetical protein
MQDDIILAPVVSGMYEDPESRRLRELNNKVLALEYQLKPWYEKLGLSIKKKADSLLDDLTNKLRNSGYGDDV